MCRHGRRMDKACHECPAEGRERNPNACLTTAARPETLERWRKPGTAWERVKADPEALAARRLYQVLWKYCKEFPEDANPPTTAAEATARRMQHARDRRERERLATAQAVAVPPVLAAVAVPAPRTIAQEVDELLALWRAEDEAKAAGR